MISSKSPAVLELNLIKSFSQIKLMFREKLVCILFLHSVLEA